ncbi:MAG TPA: 30S ribosomal protein S12 methylthiotransferase RimO [Terriglobia bacterium]|jgi:ribosomal protein S12 methylthiotransferase|nr:30S ribosomal protein S12 methylthiotransferase RimO [Terriglobia bacterium]
MPKVGMVSLGCPKNLVDSEVMLGQLAGRGWELVSRPEDADVLIVNTCSFIEPAKKESIDTILEMAAHKKTGRAQRLVVAGCLVERYRQEILKEIPEVDFVIGTNELERVLEACEPSGSDGGARTSSRPYDPYLYTEFTPRVLSTPSHFAYLKIAEGCDHPCSFCVIPQMRGRFRSRRFESVVREAETLARQGVRELVLVGQDTTSYGADLGIRNGLALLVESLARIPELVWVRFLYCYPNRMTDRLIEAVAGSPKVARYFDIPLQHSSREVLKGMRRGSDGAQFLKMLAKIRAMIPDVTLRTTMIVGFPGETDDDFRALCDFVEAAEFDHLGVFTYSNEESSGAFGLPGAVAKGVAEKRRRRILSLQRRISRRKLRGRVGQRLPVLVEGRAEETDLLFVGRLQSQAPEIDGRVLINDFEGAEPVAGEFRWARITETSDYDLVARLEAERFAELAPPHPVLSQLPEAAARLVQIQPAAGPVGVADVAGV